jgi:alpha-tubulin suppressor-like RCC1 family protein
MKHVFNSNKNDNSLSAKITSNLSLAVGDKIVAISLGYDHSSALSATGRFFRWGKYTSFRNITYSSTTGKDFWVIRDIYDNKPTEITSLFSISVGDKIVAIYIADMYSYTLSSTGRVFTWHKDYKKGKPTEITSLFSISVGDKIVAVSLALGTSFTKNHSLALSATGRVFTWGKNNFGQLGEGITLEIYPEAKLTEITSNFKLTSENKR